MIEAFRKRHEAAILFTRYCFGFMCLQVSIWGFIYVLRMVIGK